MSSILTRASSFFAFAVSQLTRSVFPCTSDVPFVADCATESAAQARRSRGARRGSALRNLAAKTGIHIDLEAMGGVGCCHFSGRIPGSQ